MFCVRDRRVGTTLPGFSAFVVSALMFAVLVFASPVLAQTAPESSLPPATGPDTGPDTAPGTAPPTIPLRPVEATLTPPATATRGELKPEPDTHLETPEPVLPGGLSEPAVLAPVDQSRNYLITSEWLLLSDSIEAAKLGQQQLAAYELRLRSRKTYPALDMVISSYVYKGTAEPVSLLATIRSEQPALQLEFNRRYFTLADQADAANDIKRYGQAITGLSEACRQQNRGYIGLLDSRVNEALPVFAGKALQVTDLQAAEPATHGTSIAALLLADDFGIAPNARVHAVNIFSPDDDGMLRTTTPAIVAGFNELLQTPSVPDVINLSFGGIDSLIVRAVITRVAGKTLLVAAAGNSGPNQPAVYPAAIDSVLAVTALDARRSIYKKANRGNYVQIAAPGVEVWTVDKSGRGYFASGTSFAVPWVAAYLAMQADTPQLLAGAHDLGAPGPDPVFGAGLLQFAGLCAK